MTAKNARAPAKPRTSKLPATVAPAPKSCTMNVYVKPGETEDRAVAGMVGRGLVTNASLAIRFLQAEHHDLSLMDMARELRDQGEAVNRGDFAVSERMLNAQAVALNTIFGELARRAALNMGEHLSATEAYMRLAFKAQAQCRSTIETLAEMKNPPVVFARQANISNGPQQVNNGTGVPSRPVRADAGAHTANQSIEQTELLEASDGERLDVGAQGTASGANPHMEPVGTLDGAANY